MSRLCTVLAYLCTVHVHNWRFLSFSALAELVSIVDRDHS